MHFSNTDIYFFCAFFRYIFLYILLFLSHVFPMFPMISLRIPIILPSSYVLFIMYISFLPIFCVQRLPIFLCISMHYVFFPIFRMILPIFLCISYVFISVEFA